MGKPEGSKKDYKKLSWTYRNKRRQGKISKPQDFTSDNVQVQNKKARIIVRNLPFKVTENDIKDFYAPFGQIEQIDLLKRPDGKPVGCGFVQFKRIEDASKAIFNTNKRDFLGRKINSTWAIPKSKFVEQLEQKVEKTHETSEDKIEVKNNDNEVVEKLNNISNHQTETLSTNKVRRTERKKLAAEERKDLKHRKQEKRARIVIRNLSFRANEEIVRKHFEKYGTVKNIEILKKSDGKRVGCAFLQFERVQSAVKAVHYANMELICERPIVVDFAVAKSKFNKHNSNNTNTKIRKESEDIKPDVEIFDKSQTNNGIEIYGTSKNDTKSKEQEEKNDNGNDDDDNDDNDDNDEYDDDDDDDCSRSNISKESADNNENEDEDNRYVRDESAMQNKSDNRSRIISHDVNEGKTVFIKNIPFSATKDEFRECMEQFGPVYYALICIDPLTEHSKGTGFVKFRNIDDAEKCLSAGTELRLHDQVLDPHKALPKQDVPDGKNVKTQHIKDSRNLYLVKEGVILAGSPAAAGISASDMTKRLQMEQWKSQMLRNLNMFVSRVRLVIHNLPPTLDDKTLREIFQNHAGPKAFITEARVMRDLRNPDVNNIGKSKEFGFVAFTKHEDALKALRSINNNPNIFSAAKRPIVAFSIENRVMVNAKKRRLEKSREHNPLWKNNTKNNSSTEKSNESPSKQLTTSYTKKVHKADSSNTINDEDVKEFTGITSKPGASTKLRSKFKLKAQALLHNKILKNEKKQKKISKKLRAQKIEQKLSRKELKPKQGMKGLNRDNSNFNELVENYRNKLTSSVHTKSKWYDT